MSTESGATPFERLLIAQVGRALAVDYDELAQNPEVMEALRSALRQPDLGESEASLLDIDPDERPKASFEDVVAAKLTAALEQTIGVATQTLGLSDTHTQDPTRSLPRVVFVGDHEDSDQCDEDLAAPTLASTLSENRRALPNPSIDETSTLSSGTLVVAAKSAYEELARNPTLTLGTREYSLQFPAIERSDATPTESLEETRTHGERVDVVPASAEFESLASRLRQVIPPEKLVDTSRIGQRVEDYVLVKRLGKGGFGEVYLGKHVDEEIFVAIKFIAAKGEPEQLRNEVLRLTKLRHPSIVEWKEWGILKDGTAFLIMEYLDGELLTDILKRENRLLPGRATRILHEILQALRTAHYLDILHLDLKPDNIFLLPGLAEDDPERIKLIDFGIGLTVGNPTDRVRGISPKYASPEHCGYWQGEPNPLDGRADLYSLGTIGFEMLTGKLPFTQPRMEKSTHEARTKWLDDWVRLHREHPPKPVRSMGVSVPRRLAHFIDQCLVKDPDRRWSDSDEAYQALDKIRYPSFFSKHWKTLVPATLLLFSVMTFLIHRASQDAPPIPLAKSSYYFDDGQTSKATLPVPSPFVDTDTRARLYLGETPNDSFSIRAIRGAFELEPDGLGSERVDLRGAEIRFDDHETTPIDLTYIPRSAFRIPRVTITNRSESVILFSEDQESEPTRRSWSIDPSRVSLEFQITLDGPNQDVIRQDLEKTRLHVVAIDARTEASGRPAEIATWNFFDDVRQGQLELDKLVEDKMDSFRLRFFLFHPSGNVAREFSLPPDGSSYQVIRDQPSLDFARSRLRFFSLEDAELRGRSSRPIALELVAVIENADGTEAALTEPPFQTTTNAQGEFSVRLSSLGLDGVHQGRSGRIDLKCRQLYHLGSRDQLQSRIDFFFDSDQARYLTRLVDRGQLLFEWEDDASRSEGEVNRDANTVFTEKAYINRPGFEVEIDRGRYGRSGVLEGMAGQVRLIDEGQEETGVWDWPFLKAKPGEARSILGNKQCRDGDYELIVAVWPDADPEIDLGSTPRRIFPVRIDTRAPEITLSPLPEFFVEDRPSQNLLVQASDAPFPSDEIEFSWVLSGPGIPVSTPKVEPLVQGRFEQSIGAFSNRPLTDGSYELLLQARDRAGNETRREIDFEIASRGPRLTWQDPAPSLEGKTLALEGGVLPLRLIADDPNGVAEVEVTVSSELGDRQVSLRLQGDEWVGKFEVDDHRWGEKSIRLRATAEDRRGRKSSSSPSSDRLLMLDYIEPDLDPRIRIIADHGHESSPMRLVATTKQDDYRFGGTPEDVDRNPDFADLKTLVRTLKDLDIGREKLRGFYLDETEVSVAQFAAFLDSEEYARAELWSETFRAEEPWRRRPELLQHIADQPDPRATPMTRVSWAEADAYARWVGKRLPSVLEWEIAVRGLDQERFTTYRDAKDGDFNLVERPLPNERPRCISSTDSLSGLFNLSTGVSEWTLTPARPAGALDDSKRLLSLSPPVGVRSFFWVGGNDQIENCHFAVRNSCESMRSYLGFRCALSQDRALEIRGAGPDATLRLQAASPQ